jgi:preprotein translocase SecE subunit
MSAQVEPLNLPKEQQVRKFKVRGYLATLKEEFHRVTWTEKGELVTLTKTVVIATLLCGMAIYVADLSVKGVLNGAATLLRLIFG